MEFIFTSLVGIVIGITMGMLCSRISLRKQYSKKQAANENIGIVIDAMNLLNEGEPPNRQICIIDKSCLADDNLRLVDNWITFSEFTEPITDGRIGNRK